MLRTRVIPCLLVEDGRLVKTVQFKKPAYIGDPINAIKIYNDKEVDELIVVDITATIENRPPNFELVSEIVDECFMPLCYGGGIRKLDDIKRLYSLGIEKVAINSYAAENPEFITHAAELFGSQSVVVSIDAKKNLFSKYIVHTLGGRKSTKMNVVDYAIKMELLGAGEILLNSIDRDGTWAGYDIDLIKSVSNAVSIPVIACGGAGKVEHFGKAVKEGGASAVAAGSMVVYQGKDLGVLINFPMPKELQKSMLY